MKFVRLPQLLKLGLPFLLFLRVNALSFSQQPSIRQTIFHYEYPSIRRTLPWKSALFASPLSQMGAIVHSSPIIGNSLVCMGLSAVGDLLAQRLEHMEAPKISQTNSLDIRRASRLAAFGFFLSGPLYSTWYPCLDNMCRPWALEIYGVWATPIVKMILEMILIEPIFLLSFFTFMNFCKGGTLRTLATKLQKEFFSTYRTSLMVWPPFMLLTFRFVPLAALTLVVNVANALWDGYLSYRHSLMSRITANPIQMDNSTISIGILQAVQS